MCRKNWQLYYFIGIWLSYFGCALPFAAMYQDFLIMRDLGANSVRTSHYPNDEIFLDLCDETGMLVWEENHARGLSEEAMRNNFP